MISYNGRKLFDQSCLNNRKTIRRGEWFFICPAICFYNVLFFYFMFVTIINHYAC